MGEIDTQTLDAPLPGGRPGATVTLKPLLCGEMLAPPGFMHREDGIGGKLRGFGVGVNREDRIWIPLPAFVIEHPGAGTVLVDTGPPVAAAHDVKAAFGRLGASIYTIRMQPEQAIAAQLRAIGKDPHAIKTVVLTHLHFDHAGSIVDLPNATFVATGKEWASAHAGRGFVRGYMKKQYEHAFDYRLIDYDAASVNSFATFGRSFDLFGDGSVMLVSTPGHSAGHQSLVLRLGGREALICGDAAYQTRTIEESTTPLVLDDEHNFKRSLREIQAYIQATPSALVIPGHDPDAWRRLEDFYS